MIFCRRTIFPWIVELFTLWRLSQINTIGLCSVCVRVVQFFFFDLNGDGMTTFNDMVDLQVWWKKYKLKTTNLILKWIEFLLEENYSFHMLVSCFWWWSQKTQFANKWEYEDAQLERVHHVIRLYQRRWPQEYQSDLHQSLPTKQNKQPD